MAKLCVAPLAVVVAFCNQAAFAADVLVTFVKTTDQYTGGVAVDATTGAAYETTNYFPRPITTYINAAAFESGAASGTLPSYAEAYGNYFAANNGYLYARTTSSVGYPSDAQISKISSWTGSAVSTVTIPGMGGVNGSDTFDWGGFSSVNAMNGGSSLLVVGGVGSSTDWTIATYDYNLNYQHSVTVSPSTGQFGFAFAIGNYVFFGDTYSNGQISTRINAQTGQTDAVDFRLTGFSNNYQSLQDLSYDQLNDVLYMKNAAGQAFYKVTGASSIFGVPSVSSIPSVPIPSALSLFASGLFGLLLQARRRFC